MLTIILVVVSLFCIALVAQINYLPQARYKDGLLFAVRLPEDAMAHEEIEAIRRRFRRRFALARNGALAAIIPLALLYSLETVQVVYFLAWLTACLFLLHHPFRLAFRETIALKRAQGWGDPSDGDEHWASGFTYRNPQDKRIFVPKRVGIGTTVNTATRTGKAFIWGTIGLVAVTLAGVAFLLIRSELTAPTLRISEQQRVEIRYPMYNYSFDLADVRELTLVDSVPSGTKSNGEGTGTVSRGKFRLKGLGKARLYIFKKHPPFIRFKLDDGYVFFNEKDPRLTEALFERLKGALGKE